MRFTLFSTPFDHRKRNVVFSLWAICVVALTCIPYLHIFFCGNGQDLYNWNIPPYAEDSLAYMAWVKQASLGSFLFKIKFTALEHDPFLFHVLFLPLGWLSALTGLQSGLTLFIGRIFASFFFLFSLGHFLKRFQLSDFALWMTLLLVGFSSGFGWLFQNDLAADLKIIDINTLWSITWSAIFPFSYGLILWSFLYFDKALSSDTAKEKKRYYLTSGGFIALLAFSHPYDVVFVTVTIFTYCLLHRFEWKYAVFFIIAVLPAVIIQFAVVKLNPILASHSQAKMLSPPFINYIVGFGLPGIIAFMTIPLILINKSYSHIRLLVLWIAVSFFLAYAPFWFQRKMIAGVHIPICILAGIGLDFLIRQLHLRSAHIKWVVMLLITLFTTPSHIINFQKIDHELITKPEYYFRSEPLNNALLFLEEESSPEDIVLAHFRTSSLIPGLSGNTVFFGHWAQSVDLQERLAWIRNYFANLETISAYNRKETLIKEKVKYILIDPAFIQSIGYARILLLEELGDKIFSEKAVSIIQLDTTGS